MSKFIIGLILLTLTTLATSVKAETTCVTNTLGDRTCTTVTSGTTTGNILNNSTFGTGNTTTTTGWSTTGSDGIHTHGNFGNFPYGSGMDQTGGVLAFEGHTEDNVYQDQSLVGDGHLTKSQINEGFTSTQSADVWFWNMIENTLTLKQTITSSDGTVTTQTRTINDHDPNRNFNGGTFENYTNVYTHSANTQNDFTIRTELYNQGDGSNNDNYHRGPDVDNVQLSITTAGTTSVVITSCQQLGTCTTIGDDINEAIDLETDDGRPITDVIDEQIVDAIEEIDETFFTEIPQFTPEIEFNVIIEDDFGFEEIPFEEFVVDTFTEFLDTNNLVEDFQQELIIEDITEQEFFEELSDQMVMEIGGDMIDMLEPPPLPVNMEMPSEMTEAEMNDFIEDNPNMVEIVDENTILIKPPEDMRMTELPNDTLEIEQPPLETEPNMEETTNEEVIEEEPTEEVIESKPPSQREEKETKPTTTEEEPNATSNSPTKTETTTTEETSESPEETKESRSQDEDVSTESEMDTNKKTEGQEETENNTETLENEETDISEEGATANADTKSNVEIDKISIKVKRIIAKLEQTLKRVDDTLQAVQFVTIKGMTLNAPNMDAYKNKQFYQSKNLNGVPNQDFFNQLNIQQEQVYTDITLAQYSDNDPLIVTERKMNEINNKRNELLLEIKQLRSN